MLPAADARADIQFNMQRHARDRCPLERARRARPGDLPPCIEIRKWAATSRSIAGQKCPRAAQPRADKCAPCSPSPTAGRGWGTMRERPPLRSARDGLDEAPGVILLTDIGSNLRCLWALTRLGERRPGRSIARGSSDSLWHDWRGAAATDRPAPKLSQRRTCPLLRSVRHPTACHLASQSLRESNVSGLPAIEIQVGVGTPLFLSSTPTPARAACPDRSPPDVT